VSDSSKAFNLLFMDLVESVLSKGDSPGGMATYLSENLRALVGARTVLVLESPQPRGTGDGPWPLLSAFPQRRSDLASHAAVQAIAAHSPGMERTGLFLPSGTGPVPEALCGLGAGPTLVSPLRYAGNCLGVLLLLDLMDTANLGTVSETLDNLSTVLALVLRNAYLYNHLEHEVSRRTAELRERSEALSRALREKDVMIKEVHHRVKNNLQIVSSLLFLQVESSADPALREALGKGQGRIHSMALVHEELYRSDDLSSVDMCAYIAKLCGGIGNNARAALRVDCPEEPIRLPITQSVPCGLILNELVTNALKYAYPAGPPGEILVSVRREGGDVRVSVEDFGVGIGPDFGAQASASLGMTLVRGLADQLHGALAAVDKGLDGGGRGSRFTVAFPAEDPPVTSARGAERKRDPV